MHDKNVRNGERWREIFTLFTVQATRRIEGEEGQSVQGRWSATGKGGYVIIAGKVWQKSLLMRDKGSRKFIERHVIRENEERAGKNIRSERN